MSNDGNVVFLKFKSEHQDEDTMAFLACKVCRNKTFTHTIDKPDYWPLVRCAACGQHIGRLGWADKGDE
jgi:hypothetical protein